MTKEHLTNFMVELVEKLSERCPDLQFKVRINSESKPIAVFSKELTTAIAFISCQNIPKEEEPDEFKVRLYTGFFSFINGKREEESFDYETTFAVGLDIDYLAENISSELFWLEQSHIEYAMCDCWREE